MDQSKRGLRGKSITPKMLQAIELELEIPKADKAKIAERYGVSVWSVEKIDLARKKQPIIVKGIRK